MLGVLWKIQEIYSKMDIRTSKIDAEISEIIKSKVGNPRISVRRNCAIFFSSP